MYQLNMTVLEKGKQELDKLKTPIVENYMKQVYWNEVKRHPGMKEYKNKSNGIRA